MFVQIEQTPNPATLKFVPGCAVMPTGTAHYAEADAAGNSPLALDLFAVDGVSGVFLGPDFISVSKSDAVDWFLLKPSIIGAIMEHFASGRPVVNDDDRGADPADGGDDDEIVTQIKELLETRVQPVVAQDGGNIVFHGFRNGVVYLHMQGACAGCPSSTMTLKSGIENMLRHYIPEVSEVRAAL